MMTDAPLYTDVTEGPDGGAAHWIMTADGVRLRVAHWSPQAARGTVLLFPGRTEYIEKYGRDVGSLTGAGFATAVIDWRGQGLADRLIDNRAVGHVEAFADYQHDVAAMLAHVRAMGLPEPYYLLAHSMGGCIGLRSLMEGLPVAAAAFSAPMWGIQMAPALRPIAWTLSTLSRPLQFSRAFAPGQDAVTYVMRTTFEENTLTSDRDMFDHMQSQLKAHPDLAIGGPSLKWLNESLREMRALSQRPAPAMPCLTFLGLDEAIVDPLRIRQRMAGWPGGRLMELPGARHEVMMEKPPIRDQVFGAVVAHFSAHGLSAAA